MRRRTRLFAAALASLAFVGTSLVGGLASPAAANHGYSSWEMRSEPGDFIGSGLTWTYTPDNAIISAEGNSEAITATLDRYSGRAWTAELGAPLGSELVVGRTYQAETLAVREADTAQLYVHGNGHGCNGAGEFTVDELMLDEAGKVERFAVRFEQRCDGDDAALVGSIAWQATEPAAALPPAAAEPVTDLSAAAVLNAAVLGWNNPGADRFVTTVVRLSKGEVPPATIRDGQRVYAGRGDDLLLRDLRQGVDFAASVFTTGPDGSVAGPVTTRLKGTHLTLAKRAHRGLGKLLVIRLTDLGGRGIDEADVKLYERRPHSDRWRHTSGWYTNRQGFARREWINYRPRYYRAVFDGAGPHLGFVTSEILVHGEPRASREHARDR